MKNHTRGPATSNSTTPLNGIKFSIPATTIMGVSDTAYVDADPRKAVVDAAIQAVAGRIEITAGGVTATLAMWLDPDHWLCDWQDALGGEDPDGTAFDDYIAGLEES